MTISNQINNSKYDTEHNPESTSEDLSKKSLKRDSSNKVIAGVCSGIANYFGLDPVLVRVGFTILIFGLGVTALAYIVLIFVIPPENARGHFVRDDSRKLIGGVGSGIAKYFDINLTSLRVFGVLLILFALLSNSHLLLLGYVVLYFVMRPKSQLNH